MAQYTEREEYDWNEDDQAYTTPVTMYEPNYGHNKWTPGEVWHICQTCSLEFPESQMGEIDGKWYCYKNKDYEEKTESLRKAEL